MITWLKDISLDIPGKKKGRRVPGYLGEGYKPGYTREEERREQKGFLVTWLKDISLDIPGKKKGRRVPGYLGKGYKPGYTREE